MTKKCSSCGEIKGQDQFQASCYCIPCKRIKNRQWMANKKEKVAFWNKNKKLQPYVLPTKVCSKCQEDKSVGEFYGTASKPSAYCRPCYSEVNRKWLNDNKERVLEYRRNWVRTNRKSKPEKFQAYELRQRCKRYGVTVDWYEQTLERQKGLCALCLLPETAKHQSGIVRSLAVDHCHEEGTARGLLCGKCNMAISLVQSDPQWTERALSYLKTSSKLDRSDQNGIVRSEIGPAGGSRTEGSD